MSKRNAAEDEYKYTRRRFLNVSARLGAGVLIAVDGLPVYGSERKEKQEEKKSEEVGPVEDLMREHGVLRRVLLVYEELVRRLSANGQPVKPELLGEAAGIVKQFVEDYHEKLEEDYLFPRFKKKDKQTELVDVLLKQHQAGRRLTEQVRRVSAASLNARRAQTADALGSFIRMYRPHAAREDTVLFPGLRGIVTPSEYDELGEVFEDKEHKLFGRKGFENMVARVAAIEKQLGIYDLSQFTPQ